MPNRRKRWGAGTYVGVAITLLWLGVMAHLVRNHLMPPPANASVEGASAELELTRNWEDVEEYMLLKLGTKTIGAFSTTVRRIDKAAGYRHETQFRLGASLRVGPFTRPINLKGAGVLDAKLNLEGFHIMGDLAGLPLEITGLAKANILHLRTIVSGQPQLSRIDMGREMSLLEAVRPTALRGFQIKPGNSLQLPVVDPLFSMQRGVAQLTVRDQETITLQGRSMEAFRVEMRLNDFSSTSWVDKRGTTLKRQLIGNLTMERASKDDAIKQSPILAETVQVPELDAADFKSLPLKEIGTLINSDKNLLGVLSGGGS